MKREYKYCAMNSIIKYLISMLFVQGNLANWNLEWNEEFESQNIDKKKWIIENQKYTCKGMF